MENANINLAKSIKLLPQNAGVYHYYDENSSLLYIGKAKNLKKRVSSYFSTKDNKAFASQKLSSRIFQMISKTTRLEYIAS